MKTNTTPFNSVFVRGDAVTVTYQSRSHPNADKTKRHALVWEPNDDTLHLVVENFDNTSRETWEIIVNGSDDTVSKVSGDGKLLGDDVELASGWQKVEKS